MKRLFTALLSIALLALAPAAPAQVLGEYDWGPVTAMSAADGKLYMSTAEGVQEYDKGKLRVLAAARDFGKPTTVAAIDGKAYAFLFSKLWEIDGKSAPRPVTGEFEYIGGLAALNGKLYLTSVNSSKLFAVDRGGALTDLRGEYGKVVNIAPMDGKLYILSRDKLHEVDPATGKARTLPGPEFNKATAFTAMNGKLYVAAGEAGNRNAANALWEVDAAGGQRRMLALPQGWSREGMANNVTAMAPLDGKLYIAAPTVGSRFNLIAFEPR